MVLAVNGWNSTLKFLLSVQGAGGKITDWKGNELVWRPPVSSGAGEGALEEGYPGEVCAAGDPELHKRAIEKLA